MWHSETRWKRCEPRGQLRGWFGTPQTAGGGSKGRAVTVTARHRHPQAKLRVKTKTLTRFPFQLFFIFFPFVVVTRQNGFKTTGFWELTKQTSKRKNNTYQAFKALFPTHKTATKCLKFVLSPRKCYENLLNSQDIISHKKDHHKMCGPPKIF